MSIFSIRKICISRPQSELFQKVRRTRQIIRFKEEKSGETEAYPAANFNAGKAYEKLNAPDKALQNYQLAYKRSPDKDIYKKNLERLQKSMPLQKSQRTKANIRE